MSDYTLEMFKKALNEQWKFQYETITTNMLSLMSELLRNAKDSEKEQIRLYISQNTKFLMTSVSFEGYIQLMKQARLIDEDSIEHIFDSWSRPLTQPDQEPCLTWSDVSSFNSMLSKPLYEKHEIKDEKKYSNFVNNFTDVQEKQYHLRIGNKVITIPYLNRSKEFPAFIKQVQKEYKMDINSMIGVLHKHHKTVTSITQIIYEFLKLDPLISQEKINRIILESSI